MSCKKTHTGDNAHMVIRGIRIRSFIHSIFYIDYHTARLTLIEAANATMAAKSDERSASVTI